MCHSYSADIQNSTFCMNEYECKYYYYHAVNTVERYLYNSYCDRNHAKLLCKIQELKEKGDKESLKLLSDNPLVGISINYRFEFPKKLSNKTHLKIIQKVVIINNIHVFKCSIKIFTKRNNKWLVVNPSHFLES